MYSSKPLLLDTEEAVEEFNLINNKVEQAAAKLKAQQEKYIRIPIFTTKLTIVFSYLHIGQLYHFVEHVEKNQSRQNHEFDIQMITPNLSSVRVTFFLF